MGGWAPARLFLVGFQELTQPGRGRVSGACYFNAGCTGYDNVGTAHDREGRWSKRVVRVADSPRCTVSGSRGTSGSLGVGSVSGGDRNGPGDIRGSSGRHVTHTVIVIVLYSTT